MHTSDHQYLARAFYSSKTIAKILAENRVVTTHEKTVAQVFQKPAGNPSLEMIVAEFAASKGYLIKIPDPARVSLGLSPSPEGILLEDIAAQTGALVAINASAYKTNQTQGDALGLVISNGKVISMGDTPIHSIIGLSQENQLILGIYHDSEIEALHLRDAVEYGPYLIINGKKTTITGNGGGLAPRTAIAQTANGKILFLVIDGRTARSVGATMKEVQDYLYTQGAVQAACLDGGASVSMYHQGALVNSVNIKEENRLLPNAFIVK